MTEINDGGAAFPFAATDGSNVHMQTNGMTLRDWYAGNAPFTMEDARRICGLLGSGKLVLETLAGLNYAYADAMIAARSAQ
jgi:hypothetical protein